MEVVGYGPSKPTRVFELAELEYPSLKRSLPYCTGRVPILVHPSLYRSLKVQFPMNVGRVSRKCRMTTELGSGSLRQAVGILTPGVSGPSSKLIR